MPDTFELIQRAAAGDRLDDAEIRRLANAAETAPEPLFEAAARLRDESFGPRITYSKKVFIPHASRHSFVSGMNTFLE